jgi:uncharacterized cupredoxin-like copper-binding protein
MKKIFISAIPAFLITILAFGVFLAFGQNQGTSVDVTLTEMSIDMPKEIPEGPVTFKVTNQGQMAHNFEITGNNVDKKFDNDLKPGESNTMDISLDAGNYSVFCPVGMHASAGMRTSLTVTKKTE